MSCFLTSELDQTANCLRSQKRNEKGAILLKYQDRSVNFNLVASSFSSSFTNEHF